MPALMRVLDKLHSRAECDLSVATSRFPCAAGRKFRDFLNIFGVVPSGRCENLSEPLAKTRSSRTPGLPHQRRLKQVLARGSNEFSPYRTGMTAKPNATLFLIVMLASCSHPTRNVPVAIAGGQTVTMRKIGTSFVGGENERFAITESGLNPFRQSGKNFLRWQFTFRAKQPTRLRRVIVEDVSGDAPVMLVDDRHPVIDGIEWTRHSELTPANPVDAPWLFDSRATLRIFRFTIREDENQESILYQAALFNRKAKDAIRFHMGPEIPNG
jgi:hypothetical protein